MSEMDQLTLLDEYRANRDILYDTLKVVDLYMDGNYRPQSISTNEWVEMEDSPGVFIKNIVLHTPDSFVLSTVKGLKGAEGYKHTIFDDLEIYCITGKIKINGIVFRARDTWFIPAATEYNFEYLEDTYLTVKFIPRNRDNFKFYGPAINIHTETEIILD